MNHLQPIPQLFGCSAARWMVFKRALVLPSAVIKKVKGAQPGVSAVDVAILAGFLISVLFRNFRVVVAGLEAFAVGHLAGASVITNLVAAQPFQLRWWLTLPSAIDMAPGVIVLGRSVPHGPVHQLAFLVDQGDQILTREIVQSDQPFAVFAFVPFRFEMFAQYADEVIGYIGSRFAFIRAALDAVQISASQSLIHMYVSSFLSSFKTPLAMCEIRSWQFPAAMPRPQKCHHRSNGIAVLRRRAMHRRLRSQGHHGCVGCGQQHPYQSATCAVPGPATEPLTLGCPTVQLGSCSVAVARINRCLTSRARL